MEGTLCNSTAACPANVPPCRDPALVLPVLDYGRANGGQCVIGGYVYRGCAIPDLRGSYVFADLSHGEVWTFRRQNGVVTELLERTAELGSGGQPPGGISSFGEDADGELYFLDYFGGRLLKIVPNAPAAAIDLGNGKVGSNGAVPEFSACGLLTRGNSARFELRRAPPSSLAVLVLGTQSNPRNLLGGTVVPMPPSSLIPVMTSAQGDVAFRLPGGLGSFSVLAQYVVADPANTFGAGISNALMITFQP
jgi:hypothetical protein